MRLTDRVHDLVTSTLPMLPEATRVLLLAETPGWTYEEVCLVLEHETQAHTDPSGLADAASLWIAAGVHPAWFREEEA